MKKYILLFGLYLSVLGLNAQNSCEETLKKAEHILFKESPFIDQSNLVALLEPCVLKGNAKAENYLGLMYLNGIGVKKDVNKAYSYISSSADKGYANAQYNMGRLYKYGLGCELSFAKAIDWFKIAAANDNQRAAYSLGYMFYKGYGVPQDYKKAVEWFERSSDPMAKHFLGVCCYLGYGLPVDEDRAIKALLANETVNSKTFLKHIQENKKVRNERKIAKVLKKSNDSTYIKPEVLKKVKVEEYPNPTAVNELEGNWNGKLVQYDWSGKHITRITPVAVDITVVNSTVKIKLFIAEQHFEVYGKFIDGTIYIENDVIFALDKLYSNDPNEETLDYTIFTLGLDKKEVKGEVYLTGLVDTFIASWAEYGEPMSLVLKSKENRTTIDEEMLLALASQEDQFIKLYPVPFNDQLTVQYQLDIAANVSVELISLNGVNKTVILPSTQQQAGEYTYTIPVDLSLPNGLYVVRLMAGDQLYTRMIIKDTNN